MEHMAEGTFTGLWATDVSGEITLIQVENNVTGSYTGRGGGTIAGTVQGTRLDFAWQDMGGAEKKAGWGYLRAMAGARTLVGLWGVGTNGPRGESIIAERLTFSERSSQSTNDKIEIKHTGYDLVRQGKYAQAIPFLEQALDLYRHDLQQDARAREGYIVDETSILTHLLECYFELADYRGVIETSRVIEQRAQFYTKLLLRLSEAVEAHQMFLTRTLQHHTVTPLKELTKAADDLKHWQKQLNEQIVMLKQAKRAEQDALLPRMLKLGEHLGNCYEHLTSPCTYIRTQGERRLGKVEETIQALTDLGEHLKLAGMQIHADVEALMHISMDWSENQRELVQWLTLLLTPVALRLENECRLIAHTRENASKNTQNVWATAFKIAQWIEKWRVRLFKDSERIDAQDLGQPFFQKLMRLFIDLGDANEALIISERSRTRAFIDLLAPRLLKLASVQQAVRPYDLDQIQQVARQQKATLVEYALLYEQTLASKQEPQIPLLAIWLVQSTGVITFRQVDLASILQLEDTSFKTLEELIRYTRWTMGVPAQEETPHVSDTLQQRGANEALRRLYQLLINPIVEFLSQNEHIIFVPTGLLFFVPFPALMDAERKYLITRYTIRTTPSIQVLDIAHQRSIELKSSPNTETLAVAYPVTKRTLLLEGKPARLLPALDEAPEEAAAVARLYNTHAIIGRNATRQVVVERMRTARRIHLAVHGMLDDLGSTGMPGAIVLAPDQDDEGILTAENFFDLQLTAELFVLSACNTGRGRLTGDGIIGLSRSIMCAGVPGIIVTLWPISDISTTMLMKEMYQHLKDGSDKATALRQAMLRTMEEYPDPVYWAAFMFIGEAL